MVRGHGLRFGVSRQKAVKACPLPNFLPFFLKMIFEHGACCVEEPEAEPEKNIREGVATLLLEFNDTHITNAEKDGTFGNISSNNNHAVQQQI